MKETEKCISANIKSVIDMIFEKECFNQQTESIFIKHLPIIIQDDRLNRLPISTLYRILNSYTKGSKQEPKIVQFILDHVNKHGLESSILLTTIEHSEENLEYIKQNVNKYKNIVKYPEFQSILVEYLIQDNQRSKENYDKKIEKIQKKLQTELNKSISYFQQEFNKATLYTNQEIRKIKEIEINQQKQKMKEQEKSIKNNDYSINELKQQIKQLKEKIFNISSSQLFYNNNDLESFNKLDGDSQALIMAKISLNNTNENIKTVSNILSYLSKEKEKLNYQNGFNNSSFIFIQTQDMNINLTSIHTIDKIFIKYDAIEMLYNNKSFQSKEFTTLIKNLNNVYFEIQYPSNNYRLIYDDIMQIKKSINPNIKMKVFIMEIKDSDKIFKNDKNINSISIETTFPTNLDNLFESMESLEDITISPSVPSIELFSIYKCPKFQKLAFDPARTQILKYSTCKFDHLVILKSINFTYIENNLSHYIRKQFPNIKYITIPSSVTSIGEHAFSDCSSLERIEIPSSVTSIGNGAFYNCSSLESIEIPSSVTSIGNSAFSGCSSLESIEIPSSVTSIGDYAFFGCSNLREITIDPNNIHVNDQNNILHNCTSLNHLIIHTKYLFINSNAAKIIGKTSHITRVTIRSSAASIGFSAFSECSSLKSIEIPSSVTSIGFSAFSGCSSLERIEIPSSVTSIGDWAFSRCSSLKSIKIPSSVTSIDKNTFYGCSSLPSVTINGHYVNKRYI